MGEIKIQKGVRNLKSIKVWDNRVSPKVALDLTDKTVYITVKTREDKSSTDDAALIKTDITVHTDAVNGITLWDLSAANSNVATGNYKGDIKIKELELVTERFDVKVEDVVTKRT